MTRHLGTDIVSSLDPFSLALMHYDQGRNEIETIHPDDRDEYVEGWEAAEENDRWTYGAPC